MTLLMLVVGKSSKSVAGVETTYEEALCGFAVPAAKASSTSAFKILPLGPDPAIRERSRPLSEAIDLARGETKILPPSACLAGC